MQNTQLSSEQAPEKKPYAKPELQVHGSVVKTTLGNSLGVIQPD